MKKCFYIPLVMLFISIFQLSESQTVKPGLRLLNVNNWSCWFDSAANEGRSTGAGGKFPHNSVDVLYPGGIMWGGMLSSDSMRLYVNGKTYLTGLHPGRIMGIRTGVAEIDTNNPASIWKIYRKFWEKDLREDAAAYFSIPSDSIKTSHLHFLYELYVSDWKHWPAEKGAPFYDADGDGKYTPQFVVQDGKEVPLLFPDSDEPGIAGADQTIWAVANDLEGPSPWKKDPLGIEQQITVWGYDYPNTHALGNTFFKRVRVIFKGNPSLPADVILDSIYLSQFTDFDIGYYGDDLTGCDSLLHLAFTYNSTTVDKAFSDAKLKVPALGVAIVQGPTIAALSHDSAQFDFSHIKGYKNLTMSSFIYFATGGEFADPFYDQRGIPEWYNLMQGKFPYPMGVPSPTPKYDPLRWPSSRYWASGDPVTRTGFLDGVRDYPGGRRMLISTGPFSMSVGDTQEVIYAFVGGIGSDNIESINVLKLFTGHAHSYFRAMQNAPQSNEETPTPNGPLPTSFSLSQNFPNPFNPVTTIRYQLPVGKDVIIRVTDLLGRNVKTLVNEFKSAGEYAVSFDAAGLSSGIYFYSIQAGSYRETKKMMLLR